VLLQPFTEPSSPRNIRGLDPETYERHLMLILVAALLLLGVVMGTVAHAPLSFTLVAAAVIGVWLAVFAVRERHARRRHTSAN
jgi:Flp pilus assembly protein TadB